MLTFDEAILNHEECSSRLFTRSSDGLRDVSRCLIGRAVAGDGTHVQGAVTVLVASAPPVGVGEVVDTLIERWR